jgi:hypothetical protein
MDINLYNEEQFKQTFLNIDFDNILMQTNNDFINSNELYIQYKSEYLTKTEENLQKYKTLYNLLIKLSNNYRVNNNKYSYTFVDKNEYNKLNKEIKIILVEQRQLYVNFMTYVQLLKSK